MDAGLTLTPSMTLVFGLLAFTVVMLVLEWIRGDLLALLVIVVIGITRLIPVEQLFDGFAGNAVISLIAAVVSRVSARTGLPLKQLLLPMACMILCGTNITMISNSPLILLNDLI